MARTVTGLHRAVKVVSREDFDLEKTFEREFEGIQRYERVSQDHPGLVDVLHVGREPDADFYYYVMELADDVSGEPSDEMEPASYRPRTLASDLRQHPIREIGECVTLGRSIAEALAHLHRAGLTHRDVKPSNIIFVKGVPRLADIGLVANSGQRTFVGTEGYVPPEGPGTSSADLYALAMVLYEMHTGKDRLDFPELPTNHELAPTVNRDQWHKLNAVICRAGSPDPRKRFESGMAFSEALRCVLLDEASLKETRREERGDSFFGKFVAITLATGLIIALAAGLFLWKDSLFPPSASAARPALTNPKSTPPPSGENTLALATESAPSPSAVEGETTIDSTKQPKPPASYTIIDPVGPDSKKPAVKVEPVPSIASEPILAYPVPLPTRRIKLDSSPQGATVWAGGEEIGRTPTSFREFEIGEVEFVFKMFGYLDKTITKVFSEGDPVTVRVQMLNDFRPAGEPRWENSILLPFDRHENDVYIAPVSPQAYDSFLSSENRPTAIGAQENIVQLNDEKAKWAFCDWMTGKDRSLGFLDEKQYHAPIFPPENYPADSFFCQIENSFGTFLINSRPEGAAIYQNGQPIGTTPDTLTLRKGPFDLVLRLDGYEEGKVAGKIHNGNTLERRTVDLTPDGSVIFGKPWKNTLGMKLVPVGDIMVAVYETRKREFDQFLDSGQNQGVFRPRVSFDQKPDHPVVGVSRSDGESFCRWLTKKERSAGLIRAWHEYRLPTDLEWSELAGLPVEPGDTPKERDSVFQGHFPWGTQWPPPDQAGNFADQSAATRFGKYIIAGYQDGFAETAPAGTFSPSPKGLYDLSGNAWEWVSDDYEKGENSLGVVRGGGWDSSEQGVLFSSYRNSLSPSVRDEYCGFRYVLVESNPN